MAVGLDLRGEGVLEGLLQAEVHVEHDGVAGPGVGLVERADHVALGVDLELLGAVLAPQVLLVLGLDATLADLAARRVTLGFEGVELLGADVAHVAEDVGGGRAPLGVAALGGRLHRDARVGRLVLLEVLDGGGRCVGEDRDRLVGAVADVVQVRLDLGRRGADQGGDLPDDLGMLGCLDPGEDDLHRGHVRHEHVARPVDDLATRGGDRDRADLVGVDGRRVVLLVDHLETPEPQDHDAEEQQDDDAHHAQPHTRVGLDLFGRGDECGDVDAAARPDARLAHLGRAVRVADAPGWADVEVVAADRMAPGALHQRPTVPVERRRDPSEGAMAQAITRMAGTARMALAIETTATMRPRSRSRNCSWPSRAPNTA